MKLISHRGNLKGPDPSTENSPNQIDKAIRQGFEVEIDLYYTPWCPPETRWWLGHDKPQYIIDGDFLFERCNYLWVHCKNLEALHQMRHMNPEWHRWKMNYFWHETDTATLTSHNYIWTYPGKKICGQYAIAVLPEHSSSSYKQYLAETELGGICSDYIYYYRGENGTVIRNPEYS